MNKNFGDFTVTLPWSKDTSGTCVFSAEDPSEAPIRSLYITKRFVPKGKSIKAVHITVEFEVAE